MSLLHGSGANNSPEGGRLSFKDYFSSGVSLPKLVNGTYAAVLQNFSFVDAKGKDDKPYVRLELRLTEETQMNRVIIDNRFEIGFSKFETEIKDQLGIGDQSMPVPALLELVKVSPLKIYITHANVEGKIYRNVNYMPVVVPPSVTGNAPVDGTDY